MLSMVSREILNTSDAIVGSIIVRFTLNPSGGAGVSSAEAVAKLRSLVESGELVMTAPDGSTIKATPVWFHWWTGMCLMMN